jgi:hypothetical protein
MMVRTSIWPKYSPGMRPFPACRTRTRATRRDCRLLLGNRRVSIRTCERPVPVPSGKRLQFESPTVIWTADEGMLCPEVLVRARAEFGKEATISIA